MPQSVKVQLFLAVDRQQADVAREVGLNLQKNEMLSLKIESWAPIDAELPYIVNSFCVIAQRQFLIESFLAIFTRVANNQVNTITMASEGVSGFKSRRTFRTGVLSFLAVRLHMTVQKMCAAEWIIRNHTLRAGSFFSGLVTNLFEETWLLF